MGDPLNIAVSGAGIAGLSLATALAQRGQQVTVYEQSSAIAEVGAGLQISPNGSAVLAALGLGDAARNHAVVAQAVALYDHAGSTPLVTLDLAQAAAGNPHPYLLMHRADLIDLLHRQAVESGARIVLDHRVDPADGLPGDADLLIGADGLHSRVHTHLNGATAPFFTGRVAWRALVPGDGTAAPVSRVWMAPKRHMVAYPLRGGSLINIVAVEERRAWVAEGWFHSDDPEYMRESFAAFAPEARALLDRTTDVFVWGLFRHDVAAIWHDDTMAILGDAAHPTLPFLAQGANMALEDAWVLAASLAPAGRAVDRADLGRALARYQAARQARVTRIVEAAEDNARVYHLENPLVRFAFHSGLWTAGQLAPRTILRRFDWIYGADVTRT